MPGVPENLLELPAAEFERIWPSITKDPLALAQMSAETRSAAASRYGKLHPWVEESVKRLERQQSHAARSFHDRGFQEPPPLRGYDFQELVELEIKPRLPILGAFLTEGSIGMLHAWRGIGKTWLVMWLMLAVACGRKLFGWYAPRARPVVYIDGEMQGHQLRERLLAICAALGASPAAGMLQILSRDLYNGPFINLANASDQLRIDEFIPADTALIVVDNISSVTLSEHSESDDLHWQGIAQWALRHRSAGRAVLFVHHSGKSGKQRGTSKREDLLDYVFTLKRPPDYEESQGCRFILEFEKARAIVGDEIKPFDAALTEDPDGHLLWTTTGADLATNDRAVELWELSGMTLSDISGELGVHKSTVSRHLTAAQAAGKLTRPYPNGKAKAAK